MNISPALGKVGWRTLVRHPWQSILMVLGIGLGVAVVVAIDLANASAMQAFTLSAESITGKATHQITGGPQGLEDALYASLIRSGLVDAAAPVISQTVTSPQLGSQPLQLLGVDPFAEAPFRGYLGGAKAPPLDQLTAFLSRPGAVLLSQELADRYHLTPGQTFDLNLTGKTQQVYLAGLLEPSDPLARRTLSGLIIADIATAQELTGQLGRLDRIDLILPPGQPRLEQRIRAMLPQEARLDPAGARQGTVAEMVAAFQTNLTALSLLALVVGLFLIYNTMTFSVVRRRPLFGTLRCLGVTRGEVFGLVLTEAAWVGLVGAGLGIGLGILLSREMVRMVTQTINDLYFTTTVREVALPWGSLVKGGLLGLFATLLTAAPPAWEASSVPPRAALLRSGLESKTRLAVYRLAASGVAAILVGVGILAYPTASLLAGFGGTLFVVVGFAMLSGLVMVGMMLVAQTVLGRLFGSVGRMAPRNLVASLSRTSVAVSALMVAVAVTIGVSLMIASFRTTVIAWLGETLQGDVYLSGPLFTQTSTAAAIDPQVIHIVGSFPEVTRVDLLRAVSLDTPTGPVTVNASSNPSVAGERLYAARDGDARALQQALDRGGLLVSEPLANRLNLPRHGSQLVLHTPQGDRSFPVAGIYYDYSSSAGTALMSLDTYRQLWQDPTVTSISLRLAPGADPDALTLKIQDALQRAGVSQQLIVRPNRALRGDVLAIFDRTFAITGALNLLTLVVAFVGVLSSLFLLQIEKQREVGILRTIGLTARQLWGMVILETGLMGAAAGVLAMPAGYALSLILVYIINRRAFGWTLQMALQPGPFLEALGVAVLAALLAGLYPAYRLGKMTAAEAVRYE